MTMSSQQQWPRHQIASAGVIVQIPPDWVAELVDDEPGLHFIAQHPAAGGAIGPALSLTTTQLDGADLEQWESATDAELSQLTTAYQLLDRFLDQTTPSLSRRLATYVDDEGIEVTLSQSSQLVAGMGVTLSVIVATEDFPELRADIDRLCQSLSYEGGYVPRP